MKLRSLSGLVGKLALAGMLVAGETAVVCADSSSRVPPTADGTPTFKTSRDFVHVIGVMQSGPDALRITLKIDDGFHINANPASQPYLIPTNLSFAGPAPLRVVYPPAVRFKPKFADTPIKVYEGTVAISALFPKGVLTRMPARAFRIIIQACTDRICLPPADLTGF